jgi:hypothetical protein
MRRVVRKTEVLLFTRHRFQQQNRQILGTCSKVIQEGVYINLLVSSDPLSSIPSTSSAMKKPENTEEGHVDPESAGERDIRLEYSSD